MSHVIINKLERLDNKILNVLSIRLRNAFLDKIMPVITHFNDYGQVYLVFAVLMLLTGAFTDGFIILLSLVIGLLCGEGILKHICKRKRPVTSEKYELLISIPTSFSFPSGHTTSSFAVLGVMLYLDMHYKYIIFGIAILISFSRIYLHVHYPSDIIGGVVLGLICAILTIKLYTHYDAERLFAIHLLGNLKRIPDFMLPKLIFAGKTV